MKAKVDRIIDLPGDIKWALVVLVAMLNFILGLLVTGCNPSQSPKECCDGRGGVQMCYHPNPQIDGYIMCKDGYICSNSRCH
jgi:hypothetical protein